MEWIPDSCDGSCKRVKYILEQEVTDNRWMEYQDYTGELPECMLQWTPVDTQRVYKIRSLLSFKVKMTDALWLKVVKDFLELFQDLIEKLHQIEVTCQVLREKQQIPNQEEGQDTVY